MEEEPTAATEPQQPEVSAADETVSDGDGQVNAESPEEDASTEVEQAGSAQRRSAGPPEDWLAKVRAHAPWLLTPGPASVAIPPASRQRVAPQGVDASAAIAEAAAPVEVQAFPAAEADSQQRPEPSYQVAQSDAGAAGSDGELVVSGDSHRRDAMVAYPVSPVAVPMPGGPSPAGQRPADSGRINSTIEQPVSRLRPQMVVYGPPPSSHAQSGSWPYEQQPTPPRPRRADEISWGREARVRRSDAPWADAEPTETLARSEPSIALDLVSPAASPVDLDLEAFADYPETNSWPIEAATDDVSPSSATPREARVVETDFAASALFEDRWPSLPDADLGSDESLEIESALRASARWARLVREQESS